MALVKIAVICKNLVINELTYSPHLEPKQGQLYSNLIMTYWKRENGDWIVFEKHEEEQKAHYFGYEFFLFFSENFRAWFLMYDDTGESLDAGECERWEARPTTDQVRMAVENFLILKAV